MGNGVGRGTSNGVVANMLARNDSATDSVVVNSNQGKSERMVIPALPMPVAVLCCILNFIVPGIGTFVAGLCTLCCAKTEDLTWAQTCCSCWISVGLALAQLTTTIIFFLGWFWSCLWGFTFISASAQYYQNRSRGSEGAVLSRPAREGSPQDVTIITVQPSAHSYPSSPCQYRSQLMLYPPVPAQPTTPPPYVDAPPSYSPTPESANG